MRPRLLGPLTLTLMLVSHPVPAQDVPQGFQAIDLLRQCESRGTWFSLALENNMDADFFGQFDLMMCASYISGIADMNALYVGMAGRGLFCFSKPGLSQEQQIRVFIKWAEAHPELLHETRRSAVVGAFMEAFPCQ